MKMTVCPWVQYLKQHLIYLLFVSYVVVQPVNSSHKNEKKKKLTLMLFQTRKTFVHLQNTNLF